MQRFGKCEAGMRVAKGIAKQIVSGEIESYEGARKIWVDVWEECRELDELTVFVGLTSGYEDEPEHRKEYIEDIIREAKTLISDSTGYSNLTGEKQ